MLNVSKLPTSHIVTLKELRTHLPRVIEAVAQGHSFTVIRRSKVVFLVSPIADEGDWQTIIDFTSVNKQGFSADALLAELNS